jgi:hypothetical protein
MAMSAPRTADRKLLTLSALSAICLMITPPATHGEPVKEPAQAHRERAVTQEYYSKQATQPPGTTVSRMKVTPQATNEADKTPTSNVPSPAGSTGGVGPLIRDFSRVPSACPFPDPKSRILRYRVEPVADGSAVTRIEIWRNTGARSDALAYASPGFGTTTLQLRNDAGVADASPDPRTRAFGLKAIDNRGRSLSRQLTFAYEDARLLRPLIKLVRSDVAFDRARGDYAYTFDFAFRELNILSATVNLSGRAANQELLASYRDLRPQIRGGVLPTGSSSSARQMTATVHAATDIRTSPTWIMSLLVQTAPPRACSDQTIVPRVTLTAEGRQGERAPPPPLPRTEGGGDSCPGEGTACTVRPADCSGRESSFNVSGRMVCEGSRAVCRAEAGRDYCTVCGGICGSCVTQLCSPKTPCAPGSVCAAERLPTGTQNRCRSLTVPEATTGRVPCTPRAGMCWLPSEVAFEPEDEDSIYNRYCAR